MSANTARRLKTAFVIMLVCIPISLTYELIDTGRISIIGVAIGILLAMPLALLEESGFDERMRRLPFAVAILAKSLTYIGSILAVFMSAGLVIGGLRGLTMRDFWASLAEPGFAVQISVGFGLYVVVVFFRQLDRLLGPGVLLRYTLGRYHRPRREARIFMFLDLKSSTTLAEELGHETYYGLVNEFFRDISGPVLEAGVHVGEVMTAEIGDLKKGLVFNGDVLNTGSRIQGECARLGRRLVSSADLFERLTLPADLTAEAMECISASCGTSLSEALMIQARLAADFLASPACRDGAVGAEYSRTMAV